jgi:hypothetical protein
MLADRRAQAAVCDEPREKSVVLTSAVAETGDSGASSQRRQFFAASFAESSQGIHGLTIQHIVQLTESPVRGEIRLDDSASNSFRVFDDPRGRSKAHPADHGEEPDEVGQFWFIVHQGVSI